MSVAQLQKQVTALEREMANAVEAEDFSEAAATKKRLEPLRLELSKLRFSERGNSGSIEEIQKKIEQLEKEMHEASEAEDFEAAREFEPEDPRLVINYRKIYSIACISLGPAGHEDTTTYKAE